MDSSSDALLKAGVHPSLLYSYRKLVSNADCPVTQFQTI